MSGNQISVFVNKEKIFTKGFGTSRQIRFGYLQGDAVIIANVQGRKKAQDIMVNKIRLLSKYKFTPIIVFSSEDDVIKDSIAAGASVWIPKFSKMRQLLVETINILVP